MMKCALFFVCVCLWVRVCRTHISLIWSAYSLSQFLQALAQFLLSLFGVGEGHLDKLKLVNLLSMHSYLFFYFFNAAAVV